MKLRIFFFFLRTAVRGGGLLAGQEGKRQQEGADG